MVRDVYKRAKPFLSRQHWQARILLWAAASLVGCVAVAFARLSDAAQGVFRELPPGALRWLLPPAGFALIAWVTRSCFVGAEGSGIPQTIHALRHDLSELGTRFMRARVIVGRVVLTVAGLLCGASIGREGPTVHVGAAILQSAGRWMPRGNAAIRHHTLVMAGGAAGIAAAFNTPLAGVVFAIEELSRSFEERTSGTAITAVVLAGITAIGLAGNYSYFGTPDLAGKGGGVSLAMLTIAISGGLFGGVFSRVLLFVTRGLPGGLGRFQVQRPVLFAACCGLLVAALGAMSGGQTYGTGYAEARAAIEGQAAMPWTYAPARALATLTALVSGIPGGLFAPSLSVGAGLGQWESALLGESAGPHWAVLGMCGYLAGMTQAPLTAFVIVLEMTGGHSMALALMLTAAIGAGTSRLVSPSLYRTLAERYVPSNSG